MRLTKPPKSDDEYKSQKHTHASKSSPLPQLPKYTKFRIEYSNVAREACSNLGADILDLAKMFDVSQPTIYNWMHQHPEFYAAVKQGRDRYDSEKVENSLLRRATGYSIEIREERLNREGIVIPLRRTIHVPADVQAAEFWLCNRNRERWHSMASKYQQLNLFPAASQPQLPGKGNGKEQTDAERYAAETLQQVAFALNDAGAFESLPKPEDNKGADSKIN